MARSAEKFFFLIDEISTSSTKYVLLACCSPNKLAHSKPDLTTVSGNDTSTLLGKKPSDQIVNVASSPGYTSQVYNDVIPDSALSIIHKTMPSYNFPKPEIWDKFWFAQYKNAGNLVDYVSADFNNDRKTDYAVILQNPAGDLGMWVLISDSSNYKSIQIADLGRINPEGKFEKGITLIKSGLIDYIDFDDEGRMKTMNLETPGVTLLKFESSATTYFWKNGKLESVVTVD